MLSLVFGDGDHRGFVQDDPPALDVNQRVGGAEVDGHVRREHAEEFFQSKHLPCPNGMKVRDSPEADRWPL